MKKSIVYYLFFIISFPAISQDIEPSIKFLINKKWERINYMPKTIDDGFPLDLDNYKLFFIDIGKIDYLEFKWTIGDPHDKINPNVHRMLRKYPYESEIFEHYTLHETEDYFLDKGCRYRLLIYAKNTFYTWIDERYKQRTEYKEYFGLRIKDLKTGEYYYNQNLDFMMITTRNSINYLIEGIG